MKKRLDRYLYEEQYFESRERARAAVMQGQVSVNGRTMVKPGTQVSGNEQIEVLAQARNYVSRGGIKLEHALRAFNIDVCGRVALDIGSSTGGFTECLLQSGATHVIAVDVGKGQLHWKLRNDPRVTVLEGINARYLRSGDLPYSPSFATIDASFISLKELIGPVFKELEQEAEILALAKPQFEAGPKLVGRGGVVKDPQVHTDIIIDLSEWISNRGLALIGIEFSPIKGPKGNIEFFLYIKGQKTGKVAASEIKGVVERAHNELMQGKVAKRVLVSDR